jgi:DNA-binding XRE family transcriptional regulator
MARKARISIEPIKYFDTEDIKQIRRNTGLSQVIFTLSLGVSPKTFEAWKNGWNQPKKRLAVFGKPYGLTPLLYGSFNQGYFRELKSIPHCPLVKLKHYLQ